MSICKQNGCDVEFKQRHKRHYFCSTKCRYDYHNHRPEVKARGLAFDKTEKGRARSRRHDRKPHRMEYHRTITAVTQRAFKNETLSCSIDGCMNTDIHKHHEDYSKPLEIIPLCRDHHRDRHNGRLAI